MDINIVISGNFKEIALFYDKISHLDLLVHINDINISPETKRSNKEKSNTDYNEIELTSKSLLSTYRSLSPEEIKISKNKKNKDKKKKNRQKS